MEQMKPKDIGNGISRKTFTFVFGMESKIRGVFKWEK